MISCVVLALNERETIGRSLASLAWCDDVHVVDSGSIDDTIEIANRAGARVSINPPRGQFLISEQRDWCLRQLDLKHDWVLFIDADEVTTPEFVSEILVNVTKNGNRYDAFYCAPKFMYHGAWLKHTKGFPNWEPRLAHKTRAGYQGGVWESFSPEIIAGYVDVPYVHFATIKGLASWVEKHVRYATWDANQSASMAEARPGRRYLRRLLNLAGPMRPWLVLLGTYTIRRSFLDGPQARSYRRRILIHELLIREAKIEKELLQQGREL